MNNASPGQQGCALKAKLFHSWHPCCILLFTLQQDCYTQKRAKFHFMVPFLAMAKLERARFCTWLIESVVTCCKICIGCFPLAQQDVLATAQTRSLDFPDELFFSKRTSASYMSGLIRRTSDSQRRRRRPREAPSRSWSRGMLSASSSRKTCLTRRAMAWS